MLSTPARDQDPEAQRPEPPSRACTPLLQAVGWVGCAALLLGVGFVLGWAVYRRTPDVPPQGATNPGAPEPPADPRAHLRDPPQGLFGGQLVAQEGDLSLSQKPLNPDSQGVPHPSPGTPHLLEIPPPLYELSSSLSIFSQLRPGALSWHSDPGLAGVLMASSLHYHEATRELEVTQAGLYYVFLNLALRRVVVAAKREPAGSLSASLHLYPSVPGGTAALSLTLDLNLPLDSTSSFRAALLPLSAGQRLSVHLYPSVEVGLTWQLAQGATLLGLFRVTSDPKALAEGLNLTPLM
ncbi:tumor necrosis factor ligand superfamily member 9 [Suncus etruscus]|uniref:tumor necrosis factor ligand superfamily member 9 n=1 Tax=Suncus etruscus TaxID=109475 RepID=UPI00210FE663|nr:tumor necrosis factor ligand superfamily member 9 [Suncus etruscus]